MKGDEKEEVGGRGGRGEVENGMEKEEEKENGRGRRRGMLPQENFAN